MIDDNKFYKRINSQIKFKTTFEELTEVGLNHFETAFLCMEHAKKMLRNGRNLISEDSSVKPKAVFISLHEICSLQDECRNYLNEIIEEKSNLNTNQVDEYNNTFILPEEDQEILEDQEALGQVDDFENLDSNEEELNEQEKEKIDENDIV